MTQFFGLEVNMMDRLTPVQALQNIEAAVEQSAARAMLAGFFDSGSFIEVDRLMADGEKPAETVAGYGTVDGEAVFAYAQDHAVCCGAVGKVQAAKIKKVYELAAQNGAPIVAVYDSDGAKLGEGIDAMDAVSDILQAANELSGVVPQIAVVTGGCVGSAALMAQAADVVIAVDGCDYRLNVGDDQAQADMTVPTTGEALKAVRSLLGLLPANNLCAPPVYESETIEGECADVTEAIDTFADPESAVSLWNAGGVHTALARIGGISCGLVTLQGEKLPGCACAKAARFVRLCDAFSLPIVTFVDAEGFACLTGASKISQSYTEATSAKITVICGRCYGPVYIAVAGKRAGADAVLAWTNALIGALPPQTAVCIEWADRLSAMTDPKAERPKLIEEYAETHYHAAAAAASGFVSDVLPPAKTREKLISLLDMLSGKRVTKLPKKHTNIQL